MVAGLMLNIAVVDGLSHYFSDWLVLKYWPLVEEEFGSDKLWKEKNDRIIKVRQ